MTKVVLIDDHKLFRDGIKALLKECDAITVVGEASDGDELIDLLQHTEVDLVLLDISMPGKGSAETAKHLQQHYPEIKVLVLSMLNNERYVQQMFDAGALGYILKNAGKEELISAIQLVAAGVPYICSDITIDLLNKRQDSQQPAATLVTPKATRELTKRELEVLSLIAEGYTNAEIAEKLFTSKRTIETHRQNLLEKTQTKNTATLIKYALKSGIIY